MLQRYEVACQQETDGGNVKGISSADEHDHQAVANGLTKRRPSGLRLVEISSSQQYSQSPVVRSNQLTPAIPYAAPIVAAANRRVADRTCGQP